MAVLDRIKAWVGPAARRQRAQRRLENEALRGQVGQATPPVHPGAPPPMGPESFGP
jgi:hypothetical protein